MSYEDEYQRWRSGPNPFWLVQAHELAWFKAPEWGWSEARDSNGAGELSRWFPDGELNTCYLALDYHVEQWRGEQAALIVDSPVTNSIERYSYAELLERTAKVAGMLKQQGVEAGDTVIIYMPMIAEAVMAMLACARIGAVHSVVFGGFAPLELASRIDDAKPKLILTASCGIEIERVISYVPLVSQALELAQHQPKGCIVFQRDALPFDLSGTAFLDWRSEVDKAPPASAVSVNSADPLYILYTSGTTGKPKGVVRDNGGHATALNYSMRVVFGAQPGDVFWSASDIGWVVGHSYIVYGPLIRGCTTVLYEGKPIMTPDAGAFWRVIEQHKVNVLFSAPTAFRAIRREDPSGELLQRYDIASLRYVFAAGERLDPPTQTWMHDTIGVPIIDNWWQTETGWPICANLVGIEELPIKYGSATKPVPGYDIHILDETGSQVDANQQGKIAIKLPLPPGCLTTIWQDFQRYQEAYLSEFPGYYCSGDGGYIDEDGYVFVMGRVDDVINVAGHRLSTGDLEEVIGKHNSVAECAVVAVNDDLKGQLPIGFVVLSSQNSRAEMTGADICAELVGLVRADVGAFACYKTTFIVPRLPKTRSGKILRKILKAMLNEETPSTPATIDDPSVLAEIADVISDRVD